MSEGTPAPPPGSDPMRLAAPGAALTTRHLDAVAADRRGYPRLTLRSPDRGLEPPPDRRAKRDRQIHPKSDPITTAPTLRFRYSVGAFRQDESPSESVAVPRGSYGIA